MIREANDFTISHMPNLKDGEKVTRIENFFNEEDFNGMGRLFGITIIEPGGSIGKHVHTDEQEAYFILEGVATYNDNGIERKLYPGQLALCKDGEFHGIKNDGNENLRYIALISYTK